MFYSPTRKNLPALAIQKRGAFWQQEDYAASYETDLYVKGSTPEIVQADGTSIVFSRSVVSPDVFLPASPMQGKVLAQKKPQGTEYTWTWNNGRQLNFNAAGKTEMQADNGAVTHIRYDRGGNRIAESTHTSSILHTAAQGSATTGRAIAIRTVAYRDGKPGESRLVMRYEYAPYKQDELPGSEPVLIARPSVVPGKEHQIRITYNGAQQPLTVVESGWSPAVDGNSQAIPIARTTAYGYTQLNGRRLLTSIDGPLRNGPTNSPADSDVIRLEWDSNGKAVTAMIAPGDFKSTVRYDDAGRVVEASDMQGRKTVFTYDAQNQLTAMTANGVTQETRYDALGNPVETGYHDGKAYKPLMRFGFDGTGRQVWAASLLGILQYSRYNTEGQLLESGHADSRMAQVRHYAYDSYGRLAEARDSRGMRVAIEYDERGRPVRFLDALGRPHESVQPRSGDGGAPMRRLADDFGRVIATISPDSGTTLQQFDEAGHLIGSTDAQGNRATYEYDAAGRIARQTITDKTTGQASVTVWRYQGRRLVALEHPSQSEQYRYDEHGLLVARTVRIKRNDGSDITSITRYAYGDDGVLQSVSLPDGSRLDYERNGQGQVVAVKRSRIQTSWLQWLLPAKTLVADLQRDLVGIQHYTAGNGIEADYQRSREGVLARIVYRHDGDKPSALPKTASAVGWLIAAANASEPPGKPEPGMLPGALGLPEEPNAVLDLRYLWDVQGNLLHLQQKAGAPAAGNYAYDRDDRLIAAVQTEKQTVQASRYFYDAQGRRLLSQQDLADQGDLKTNTEKALYQAGTHRWLGQDRQISEYDVNGQPRRIGERAYRWDALGRLLEVRQHDKTLARYTYNHRGERIAKDSGGTTYYLYRDQQLAAELDGQGSIKRQYVYLAEQPVAVIDTPQGTAPQGEERDAVSRIAHDLATIVHAWFADDEKTVWLHANHLGAIEAATAQDGALVWRARYQPSGQASIVGHGFTLHLRLPGQYEDAETGLFYNGRRYYDPQGGRYLTPDPLGTPDGPNPYAYVAHNPLRYIDPSGLVLFAFDGTGNSNDMNDPAMKDSNYSNVWRFSEAYDDGNARYVSGVGTVHKDVKHGDIVPDTYAKGKLLDWLTPFDPLYVNDMGGNYSGPARIKRMMLYLQEEANAMADNESMDIDIVGFSRGAAEARQFANMITAATKNGAYRYNDPETGAAQCQKVNFRFMGLFDTVLSTNFSGQSYQMAIPGEFSHVVQAVALNEYRSSSKAEFMLRNPKPHSMHWGGFPLQSIGQSSSTPGKVRLEMGFLGAHADIGGGYAAGEDQLSLVALNWMVRQAQDAGVKMNVDRVSPLPSGNPVLHDPSKNIVYGDPNKWQSTYPSTPNPDPNAPPVPYLGAPEDRQVVGAVSGSKQRTMGFGNSSMTNADTHQFISYAPRSMEELNWGGPKDARTMGSNTGTVDVEAYLQWLRQHGYCFVGDTQGSCAAKVAALP